MVSKDKRIWAERPSRYNRRKYGPKGSQEWKDALSRAHKGKIISLETREKMSAAHKGHIVSKESKDKSRESNKKTWASEELRAQHSAVAKIRIEKIGISRSPYTHTKPENILVEFLRNSGFVVEREKQFGRFRVDAYLPERHLAFECDGIYYHQRIEKDRPGYYADRDAELLRRFWLRVIRLTDQEILTLLTSKGKCV